MVPNTIPANAPLLKRDLGELVATDIIENYEHT
jgi:hypothetical protein